MLANYGYTDASGSYFITIDTDLCDGCGDCITACPQHIFEVNPDDYGENKAEVKDKFRNNLKYVCAICKPASGWQSLPCSDACQPGAIKHSW
ncbi:MAG: ferredoxin [Dehalococcoidales bacterium]|nr:ferredoxin [Dehalococcoidales bacterium]